jgi:hypothetical protein
LQRITLPALVEFREWTCPNLSAPGAVSVIIVSNFGSFVDGSMIPERMTWKASPR